MQSQGCMNVPERWFLEDVDFFPVARGTMKEEQVKLEHKEDRGY